MKQWFIHDRLLCWGRNFFCNYFCDLSFHAWLKQRFIHDSLHTDWLLYWSGNFLRYYFCDLIVHDLLKYRLLFLWCQWSFPRGCLTVIATFHILLRLRIGLEQIARVVHGSVWWGSVFYFDFFHLPLLFLFILTSCILSVELDTPSMFRFSLLPLSRGS